MAKLTCLRVTWAIGSGSIARVWCTVYSDT